MMEFIIKSTICLAVLYVFYYLILRNIKTFEFNRFYLLFSLVFALIIPFIKFKVNMNVPVNFNIQEITYPTGGSMQVEVINAEPTKFFTIQNIFTITYFSITIILLLRFLINIYKILKLIRKSRIIKDSNVNIVLLDQKVLPYSFFKYIFLNSYDFNNGKLEKELIIHEQTHCVQYHSIDILFIEFLRIVLWFNPFIWLFKKAIQLNHEFLADNKVLSKHDLTDYQHTLVNLVFRNNSTYLASNFNYSLTKKRLIMMTKQKSNERAFIKKIMIVPILAILVLVMACSKEEKLFISGNVDTKSEFLDNMKKTWWYPILEKHDIEPHGYNTFYNVFEMGTTNSIDNKIVTLENAFFVIWKDSTEYGILRSPVAYHDLDSNIITGIGGTLETYSTLSQQTKPLETFSAEKIIINLHGSAYKASDAKGIVSKTKK